MKVLHTRYGNVLVYCDQEECLREVVHGTVGKLGLPTGVTAVEQIQAKGRAAQRVRAPANLGGRRKTSGSCDYLRAPCCSVGSLSEYSILVKRDVDLQDGGTVKITPHVAFLGARACSKQSQR